jgi:hypothetical protein
MQQKPPFVKPGIKTNSRLAKPKERGRREIYERNKRKMSDRPEPSFEYPCRQATRQSNMKY